MVKNLSRYCVGLILLTLVLLVPAWADDGPKPLTNTIGMRLVPIRPGEFLMGSPAQEAGRQANETQHRVKLTKPFLMGVHHVTRGQFAAFINDSGYKTNAEKDGWAWVYHDGTTVNKVKGASWRSPGFQQGDDHPVVQVNWDDAVAFCDWLSKKENRHYRLPTEAQWEYACRAGTQTVYFWGDSPDAGKGFANCADLTGKQKFPTWRKSFNWADGFIFTSPVGSFKPNAFGLYDMHGNAWQWCSDYPDEYPAGDVQDPTGASVGDQNSSRVLRGGSWRGDSMNCRAAFRHWVAPDARGDSLGFRVCLAFP